MISTIIGGGRIAAALTAAAALLAAPVPAFAGSFRVNPVRIALVPNRPAAELTLTNVEQSPVGVRVTAVRWTQVNGEDVYEPTTDVIASPPIFTLAGGGTQLVRLGLRTRRPGAAYRIYVEEIPAAGQHSGVRVALKIDLPLHVLAEADAKPALSWAVRTDAQGNLVAEAHNGGTGPGQVNALEVQDGSGRTLGASRARGTVLPGSTRIWRIGRAGGAPATLLVTTPDGVQRSSIGALQP